MFSVEGDVSIRETLKAEDAAEMQADKFNSTFPVGTRVTYVKSQVEGRLVTTVTSEAKVYESYQNNQFEYAVMAELENVGYALISKIENSA